MEETEENKGKYCLGVVTNAVGLGCAFGLLSRLQAAEDEPCGLDQLEVAMIWYIVLALFGLFLTAYLVRVGIAEKFIQIS